MGKEHRRASIPTRAQPDGDTEEDALGAFLAGQSRKCAAHNRAQTNEVLELIRRHRKGRNDPD